MKCSITNCNNSIEKRTWCGKHYRRWQRHGDVNTIKKAPNGTGCVYTDMNGYVRVQLGKKSYKLHRLIMEEHLGRKLKKHELIHHKNEIRNDNSIENLQIVSPGEHMVIHYKDRFRNPLNTKTHKRCPTCKEVRKRIHFYNCKSSYDGLCSRCKVCSHDNYIKYYLRRSQNRYCSSRT